MYEDDSRKLQCDLPVDHDGEHQAAVSWPDEDCANWQHGGWDEAVSQITHTREGIRDD